MKQFEQDTIMWTLEKCINELGNLDELDQVYNLVKDKRRRLSLNNKYKLIIGEEVTVTGSGKFETGKILKLNRTRAKLEVYVGGKKAIYTVPYSMIRAKIGEII